MNKAYICYTFNSIKSYNLIKIVILIIHYKTIILKRPYSIFSRNILNKGYLF